MPADNSWVRLTSKNKPLNLREIAGLLDHHFPEINRKLRMRIEFLACSEFTPLPSVEVGIASRKRDREEFKYLPALLEIIVKEVASGNPEGLEELIDGLHDFAITNHNVFAADPVLRKVGPNYATRARDVCARAAIHAALATLAVGLFTGDPQNTGVPQKKSEGVPEYDECLNLAAKCWNLCLKFHQKHLNRKMDRLPHSRRISNLEMDRRLHIPTQEDNLPTTNSWIRWSTRLLKDKWDDLECELRAEAKLKLVELLKTLETFARNNIDAHKKLDHKVPGVLLATVTAIVDEIQELDGLN